MHNHPVLSVILRYLVLPLPWYLTYPGTVQGVSHGQVIPCTWAPLYTAVSGYRTKHPGTGSHCTNSLAVYPSTRESGCIHNCVLRTPIIPLFGCDLHVNPVYRPMPSLIPSDTAIYPVYHRTYGVTMVYKADTRVIPRTLTLTSWDPPNGTSSPQLISMRFLYRTSIKL